MPIAHYDHMNYTSQVIMSHTVYIYRHTFLSPDLILHRMPAYICSVASSNAMLFCIQTDICAFLYFCLHTYQHSCIPQGKDEHSDIDPSDKAGKLM